MAILQIDFAAITAATGDTIRTDSGANISSETAVICEPTYAIIPATNSIKVEFKYWISQAMKNAGGTEFIPFKNASRGPTYKNLTNLAQNVFDTADPPTAMGFFKDQLDTFFDSAAVQDGIQIV